MCIRDRAPTATDWSCRWTAATWPVNRFNLIPKKDLRHIAGGPFCCLRRTHLFHTSPRRAEQSSAQRTAAPQPCAVCRRPIFRQAARRQAQFPDSSTAKKSRRQMPSAPSFVLRLLGRILRMLLQKALHFLPLRDGAGRSPPCHRQGSRRCRLPHGFRWRKMCIRDRPICVLHVVLGARI